MRYVVDFVIHGSRGTIHNHVVIQARNIDQAEDKANRYSRKFAPNRALWRIYERPEWVDIPKGKGRKS